MQSGSAHSQRSSGSQAEQRRRAQRAPQQVAERQRRRAWARRSCPEVCMTTAVASRSQRRGRAGRGRTERSSRRASTAAARPASGAGRCGTATAPRSQMACSATAKSSPGGSAIADRAPAGHATRGARPATPRRQAPLTAGRPGRRAGARLDHLTRVRSMSVTWTPAGEYEDIRYELSGDGIAKITIDRPEVRNAFRPADARSRSPTRSSSAREDTTVGVIVLTGEGPHAFCSGGDQRVRGDTGYMHRGRRGRALPRHRPAHPDPPAAQAGRRDGRGLRHRRRPRAAPRLRPDDRRRQRALRADRAEGRLVRRRLRRRPAGPPRRAQEGQGDLVPVPPVRRRARRSRWAWSNTVVPLERLEEETVALVPRDARALAVRPAPAEGELQRRRGRAQRASSSSRTTPTSCSTPARRPRRAARPTRRSAPPTSRSSPSGLSAAIWLMAARLRTLPGGDRPRAGRHGAGGAEDDFRARRVRRRAAGRDLHPGRDQPVQRLLRRPPRRGHRGPPRAGARHRRRPRPAAPGADRHLHLVRPGGRSAAPT